MCLIVFAHQLHPDYPLILSSNRDEFLSRPTQNMHWWKDINILAGKDLQAGGTWLAIHKNGRWAALTNYRMFNAKEAHEEDQAPPQSRGRLVVDFLSQDGSALAFAKTLDMEKFSGFNLLLWDNKDLVVCANKTHYQPQVLPKGLYSLSNGHIHSTWPKCQYVKEALSQRLSAPPSHDFLQKMMRSTDIAQDHLLPKTGVALALERRLSACYIKAPEYDYGTRTCISMYRNNAGEMDVFETCFDTQTPSHQQFFWTIQQP